MRFHRAASRPARCRRVAARSRLSRLALLAAAGAVAGPASAQLQLHAHPAYPAGLPDQFPSAAASVSDVPFYTFRLLNTGGAPIMVTQVSFSLVPSGIAPSDVSDLRLFRDPNSDGIPDLPVAAGGVVGGSVVFPGIVGEIIPGADGLSYLGLWDVANLAAGDSATVDLGGAGVTPPVSGDTPPVTHWRGGILALGPHVAGAAPDAFGSAGTAADALLYRFRLEVTAGDSIEIRKIVLDFPTTTGIAPGDWSDFRLFRDENGSGAPDAGEPEPLPVVTPLLTGSGGTVEFDRGVNPPLPLAEGQSAQFLFVADVAGLVGGDRATIDLTPGGVGTEPAGTHLVQGDVAPVEHRVDAVIPAIGSGAWIVLAAAIALLAARRRVATSMRA